MESTLIEWQRFKIHWRRKISRKKMDCSIALNQTVIIQLDGCCAFIIVKAGTIKWKIRWVILGTSHKWSKKGIADHAAWHRSISKAKIPYLYPDPTSSFHNPQVIARFPCPEENCRFQPPFLHYGAYAAHKTQDRFRTLIGQPISGILKPGPAPSRIHMEMSFSQLQLFWYS